MNTIHEFILMMLGPDGQAKDLTVWQIALRAMIIFIAGLGLVRIGDRRSLSQKTAFDAIFVVLLGSMLSRTINGTAPFFTTIAAAVALVLIHRAFAFGACSSRAFAKFIKGREVTVVRNGKVDWAALKKKCVSCEDFEEDLRLEAKTEDVSDVTVARFERSGDISFIKNGKS